MYHIAAQGELGISVLLRTIDDRKLDRQRATLACASLSALCAIAGPQRPIIVSNLDRLGFGSTSHFAAIAIYQELILNNEPSLRGRHAY